MEQEGEPGPRRIEITKDHIGRDRRKGGQGCPVYLALRESGVDVEYVDAIITLIRERPGQAAITEIRNGRNLSSWMVRQRNSGAKDPNEATLTLDLKEKSLRLESERPR